MSKSNVGFIRDRTLRALALITTTENPLRDLSIALVGDRQMTLLHACFMGVAETTDVLTFPIDIDSRGRTISGEIVICVPVARQQAKMRKIPVEHELLLYAIHGMLHLSGFDDRTDAGFRRMHAKEDEILIRLGVGAIFDPIAAADARSQPQKPPKRKRRRLTGKTARRGARR